MSDVDAPPNTDAEIKGEGATTINHHVRHVSLPFTDTVSHCNPKPPEPQDSPGKYRNKSEHSFDGLVMSWHFSSGGVADDLTSLGGCRKRGDGGDILCLA